jgi:hypothetical protein
MKQCSKERVRKEVPYYGSDPRDPNDYYNDRYYDAQQANVYYL